MGVTEVTLPSLNVIDATVPRTESVTVTLLVWRVIV